MQKKKVCCGCWKLGELLDHATLDSVGDNNLIQLVYGGMLLEKSSGSQNCITFIGTGKQCPLLISMYDTAVMVINSAYAGKLCFEKLVGPARSTAPLPLFIMCVTLLRKLVRCFIFHFILSHFQFLPVLPSSVSQSWMYLTLEKVITDAWKNIEIRRCQVLYWPILLKDNVFR